MPHRSIETIRRENLRTLAIENGGVSSLASAVGRSHSQISQWLNASISSKTGRPRTISSDSCRYIEKSLKKPAGWLDQDRSSKATTHRIPLVRLTDAGNGHNSAKDYLFAGVDTPNSAFAIEVDKASMVPTFQPGDTVIIDQSAAPSDGDFVVALCPNNEVLFKRYKSGRDNSGVPTFSLVPLNSDFSARHSDNEQLKILGTVIEHRTYYRR